MTTKHTMSARKLTQLERAAKAADDAVGKRDDLIYEAVRAKVPVRKIEELTGLPKSTVHRIANKRGEATT